MIIAMHARSPEAATPTAVKIDLGRVAALQFHPPGRTLRTRHLSETALLLATTGLLFSS